MSTLRAPNPTTSPLVRGGRFVMIGLGFMYGAYKLKKYTAKEVDIQIREDAIRARRAQQLAEERRSGNIVEMNKLAEEVGVPDRMK